MKRIIISILAVLAVALPFALTATVPADAHGGGSGLCLEEYNSGAPFGCLNAWNGGPWVRMYTGVTAGNNQFNIICPQYLNGTLVCALQFVGGGPWNGYCVGDAYNDPNRADTSLDPCPTATYSGGWGTRFYVGTGGCYTDNGGGQSGWWQNVHWGGYLGVGTGNFQNDIPFYLNNPFHPNPDYTCFYGEIVALALRRPSVDKVSKESQNYRPAGLWPLRCGTCAMFRAPDSCTYVGGVIRRRDRCDAWSAVKGREITR